ncbi:hypothetical protein N0V90_010887 [Kalmusia sp. IMI 367209]|nr:hypothetical protein N0V90_010887 [Kalmusia sp. IMI 367209]
MAPELLRKRKRGNVSYREPSSDEDTSNSDLDVAPRTKRPTRRSNRHHSTEAQSLSTKNDRSITSPSRSRPLVEKRPSRRQGKRTVSYREESTDQDSDEAGSDDYEEEVIIQREPRAQAAFSRSKPSKPPRKSSSKAIRPRVRPLGAPLKEKNTSQPTPKAFHIPTDGRKPDMSALPYHVLLQIFVYASHPLHDENMLATPSISWLTQMARMCQAFTKPALTALYRNPPIFALKQNRRQLVHNLINPTAGVGQDYQVMVKRLELDATQMSALTDATQSATDLASLVAALSTLRDIDIFDPLDRPPYRERLRRIRRWYYPDEFFNALRQSQLRLQSWRWNSAFCNQGLLWVKGIHADGPFQSIRELTFVKFNNDERRKETETNDPTTEELLASAIAVLPKLRSLAFESCTAVNGKLLALLPSALLSLSITNCINLTSDALQACLSDHGRHLEELVLNHNQSLDLSFLVDLKQSCPRLEVLKMDLNYYSTLALSSDNEPLYDWLLGIDEIPSWPTTLRIIDLEHLRKWNSAIATNFFTSLIESAADLPWLRELRILSMVDDMGWRQRADFRRKWAARFEKVFTLRCPAPSPHLASLKAYREWKAAQHGNTEKNDTELENSERNDSLLDAVQEAQAENAPASDSDSDAPLLARRRQKQGERWDTRRLRSRAKASTNYEETSEDGINEDDSSDDGAGEEEPKVIQGRCHTVLFRIDNLRPREELFDEGDFLDSERSGDEEWDGNDEVDEGYAW